MHLTRTKKELLVFPRMGDEMLMPLAS